jgi:hypothetical protein
MCCFMHNSPMLISIRPCISLTGPGAMIAHSVSDSNSVSSLESLAYKSCLILNLHQSKITQAPIHITTPQSKMVRYRPIYAPFSLSPPMRKCLTLEYSENFKSPGCRYSEFGGRSTSFINLEPKGMIPGS